MQYEFLNHSDCVRVCESLVRQYLTVFVLYNKIVIRRCAIRRYHL